MVDDEKMLLPPGYRFYPTEEELISFYLHEKLQGRRRDLDGVIPVLYIYDFNPWDLPKMAGERCRSDPQLQEWFFYIPRQEKEARGGRPNRLTTTSYWKATGSPGLVYSSSDNRIIGIKKTMVFYRGRARARSGSKTDWKMNEYIAIHPTQSLSSTFAPAPPNGEFTVCRVYKKSKCLRAFDRRPGAPPLETTRPRPIISSHQHQPVVNHQLIISSDHQNQPQPMTIERVNSGDQGSSYSSSRNIEDICPFQYINDQENNLCMDIDQTPLWDFDSVNWSW